MRWRIERADGGPVAIAGIWECRPADQLLSFSMLTINADGHPLMQRFHKPDDEKRMVMILDPDQYQDWLDGSLVTEEDVYRQYPAELLVAQPDPMQPRSQAKVPVPAVRGSMAASSSYKFRLLVFKVYEYTVFIYSYLVLLL